MSLNELKERLLKNPRFQKAYFKRDLAYAVSRMLIEARVQKGFTQEKLASAIGTTQSSIARAERSKHAVSFDFLEKIAKAYKTYVIPPRFAFMDKIMAVELRNPTIIAQPNSSPTVAQDTVSRRIEGAFSLAFIGDTSPQMETYTTVQPARELVHAK